MEPDVPKWGYKFHMNDLSAAVGIVNLKHVPEILAKCRDNTKFYDEALGALQGVKILDTTLGSNPSYWLYSIKIERKAQFLQFMSAHGVMVSQVHAPNDKHSNVRAFSAPLPLLDKLEELLVCITVGWWVTESDKEHVVRRINKFLTLSSPPTRQAKL